MNSKIDIKFNKKKPKTFSIANQSLREVFPITFSKQGYPEVFVQFIHNADDQRLRFIEWKLHAMEYKTIPTLDSKHIISLFISTYSYLTYLISISLNDRLKL